MEALRGQAGWLRVTRLTVKAAGETATHLLLAAIADAGHSLPEATLDRLFLVPGTTRLELGAEPPTEALEKAAGALRDERLAEAEAANGTWMDQETGKLDAYAEDMERAADAEIKSLEAEVKARRKALRVAGGLTVAAKVEEQRAIKKLEGRRDELMLARFSGNGHCNGRSRTSSIRCKRVWRSRRRSSRCLRSVGRSREPEEAAAGADMDR